MPIRKLPENNIVVSLYRSGLSSGEIAEKFNVKPITVLSMLSRIGEPRRKTKEVQQLINQRGRRKSPRYWLGKKHSAEMIEKRVSKIRGENHYLWKGGKDRRNYRGLISKIKCEKCKSKLNLGIHHKDFDHYNDTESNLQVLCVSCHISLHKKAYWDAIHSGKTPLKSNAPIGWEKGKSTEGKV